MRAELDRNGAALVSQALSEQDLAQLVRIADAQAVAAPGQRLNQGADLAALTSPEGPLGATAACVLGPAAHPIQDCLAEAGDIWVYRTVIPHRSDRAKRPRRRRVLQVDDAAEDLPPPLAWLGLS